MSYVHTSRYFETVEGYLFQCPNNCSIGTLNNLVQRAGCPNDLVDQVVNGAIVDYIMCLVSGPDNTVTCTDMNGRTVPTSANHSTRAELIEHLTETKFSDLSTERARKIVDDLLKNHALSEDSDGSLYRSKQLIVRQLVAL